MSLSTVAVKKPMRLHEHIQNFLNDYLKEPVGQKHLAMAEAEFVDVPRRFIAIRAKYAAGQEITDDVLNGLLPHGDSPYHRENGYRISQWPCVTRDVRQWFEASGWKKPEDWKPTAELIFTSIDGLLRNDLVAWQLFVDSPYRHGFGAGFISPILFALDRKYPVINSKVVKTYNYCSEHLDQADEIDASLANYLANADKVQQMQARLADYGLTSIVYWDVFCHYMVSKRVGGADFTQDRAQNRADTAGAWLFVANPQIFRWEQAFTDGGVTWTGSKGHYAQKLIREYLRAGDRVLGYQARPDFQIVCELQVDGAPYMAASGSWGVNLKPIRRFANPLPLSVIKAEPALGNMEFLQQTQLSVSAVTKTELAVIERLVAVPWTDSPIVTLIPTGTQAPEPPFPAPTPAVPSQPVDPVEQLCQDLIESQHDTTRPRRYEAYLAQAFAILGFEAEHIGGAGKPDTFLTARLGSQSYTAVVEAKTCQAGSVLQLSQVNYASVDDHRQEFSAEYSVLLAPGFSGGRVTDQAIRFRIGLLTTDSLVQVLRQHALFPFSLEELRVLFQPAGTNHDCIAELGRIHYNHLAYVDLLQMILIIMDESQRQEDETEPVSANAIYVLLSRQARSERKVPPLRSQIDEVLSLLASPLLAILQRVDGGYTLSLPLDAARQRIHVFSLPPAA